LVNGEMTGSIDVNDRGLAYADGVFETISVHRGHALRWEYHWRRLSQGCRRLNLKLGTEQSIKAEIESRTGKTYLAKLIVTRASRGRGYSPNGINEVSRIVQFFDLPERDPEMVPDAINTAVLSFRLGLQPALAGIKHLARLENVLARAEADQKQLKEALLLDINGHLVEGCQSNIVLLQSSKLFTPKLDQCGVQGVYLSWLADHVPIEAVTIKKNQLKDYDGLFFCNTVRGIVPVKRVEDLGEFDVEAVIDTWESIRRFEYA